MNIELNKRILFWEKKQVVDNYNNGKEVDFAQINYRIEQLLHGAESCKKMIDNRRKISDNDFYNMLNEFAFISRWNDYDCYNVLELVYNIKFICDTEIKTTMHTVFQRTEGYGRNFSWWEEEVGINFKVLYTEDFKVDYEHVYTIEELKKLIAEKKIIIVCEKERNLTWNEDNYKKEEYEMFDYAYNDYNMKHEFFDEDGKFFPYTIKYIKKQLNNKKLKKLFTEHLKHVNCEVKEAIDGSVYGNDSWSHVKKEYSKEFEELGFSKRLRRLNESKF